MRTRHAAVKLLALSTLATVGCVHNGWSAERISYGVRADVVYDLESVVVDQTIPVTGDRPVRIRNLAGKVELVMGSGQDVEVQARIFAKGSSPGQTQALLEAMTWSTGVDDEGRREWTLGYPVDSYSKFHYSTEGSGFAVTTKKLYGRRVKVTTAREPGAPTLFADLTITYPAHAPVHLRHLAGPVSGGDLEGSADLAVATGDVTLGSFRGSLSVDTGSGDVSIRALHGTSYLDTGSGDIRVASLTGTGNIETGSGQLVVERADAERIHADTGSGDIVLGGGRIAELYAETGSGDIDIDAEVGVAYTATGSGAITIDGDLTQARSIHADTGSGDITIHGGPAASFVAMTRQGSGRFHVGYDDAAIDYDGRRAVAAKRGDGRTVIHMDTGSGNCVIRP